MRKRYRGDKPRLPRRSRAWFVRELVFLVVVGVLLLYALGHVVAFVSMREIKHRVLVEIPEGKSVGEIAAMLESVGLTVAPRRFVLATRILGYEEELQAGSYEFGPRFSEMDVLTALNRGEVAVRRVTIPEGFRAEQIAEILEAAVGMDREEFMERVRDPAVVARLGFHAPSLEGYLMPDTYRVELDMTVGEAIEMTIWGTRRIMERYSPRAESLGMTMHEILTLASIVESEAMFNRERARISAVYHNRLGSAWRLEADPTVRYAKGVYHRKLFYSDLRDESPYNTYRNKGLPPGPICSPGMASIIAALYPLEGNDEYFFVANGDGTHTFTRTFHEHAAARERIARERKERAEFSLDAALGE
jgi:UPF0755 protein